MPSGEKVTIGQRRLALKLLDESREDGSKVRRADIPRLVGIHRHTFRMIVDQAAVNWYRSMVHAEWMEDVREKAR